MGFVEARRLRTIFGLKKIIRFLLTIGWVLRGDVGEVFWFKYRELWLGWGGSSSTKWGTIGILSGETVGAVGEMFGAVDEVFIWWSGVFGCWGEGDRLGGTIN